MKHSVIILAFLLTLSSQASAEIITITCKAADTTKSSRSTDYLVDLGNQRLGKNSNNTEWLKTLYWTDNYIATVLEKGSMGDDSYLQSSMMVLDRKSMLMVGSTVTLRDFNLLDSNEKYKPHSFSLRCVRGF